MSQGVSLEVMERAHYELRLDFKGMSDQLVDDVQQGFKNLDSKVLKTVSKANDLYKKLGEDFKKRLTFMDSRINKLEVGRRSPREEGALGKVFSGWFDEEHSAAPKGGPTQEDWDSMHRHIAHLEGLVQDLTQRPSPNPNWGDFDFEKRFAEMDARQRELSNHVAGTKSFQADGMVFKDYAAVLEFVEKYNPPDIGEYADAFTTWGLAAPTPGSGQQDAARFVSSKKAGRTPKESDLLASLKDDSPPILFSNFDRPRKRDPRAQNQGLRSKSAQFQGIWGDL